MNVYRAQQQGYGHPLTIIMSRKRRKVERQDWTAKKSFAKEIYGPKNMKTQKEERGEAKSKSWKFEV